MPKLDGTHIPERLKGRLEEVLQGKEVAARDLRALLSKEQAVAMDVAWALGHGDSVLVVKSLDELTPGFGYYPVRYPEN
jgi:HEAT repeat protein